MGIREIILSVYFLVGFLFLQNPQTSEQKYTEYEVKAGYLFHFTRFVEFPEGTFQTPETPIIIGIYGNQRISNIIIKTLEGKTADGRKLIFKQFNRVREISDCHILYINKTSNNEIVEVLKVVNLKPVLTVGDDIEGFCQMGGIINFLPQYSHKRFEINNSKAKRKNIIISSKLLALANIIQSFEIEF